MYKIIFHKEVTKDLKSTLIALIKVIKTIDERLSIRPYDFKPLSRKIKDCIDFGIEIYSILEDKNSVLILAIGIGEKFIRHHQTIVLFKTSHYGFQS